MVNLGPRRRAQHGFLLSATIILLLVTSFLTLMLAWRWDVEDRLLKERELFWIGQQFRRALLSYADATPPGYPEAPRVLEDLLVDERGGARRQHLRRLFVDPMTGRAEWGVERSAEGGIEGVHSLSTARPLRREGLWPVDPRFDRATRYADWVFAVVPVRRLVPPSAEE